MQRALLAVCAVIAKFADTGWKNMEVGSWKRSPMVDVVPYRS
jgi:hypothetical protein